MHRRGCVLLIALPVWTHGLWAQGGWDQRAHEEVAFLGNFLEDQGYAVTHQIRLGELPKSTREEFWVELSGGMEYALLGVCDTGCRDVDLELFDQAGNSLDSDYQFDDAPVVRVAPDSLRRYRVQVRMARCVEEMCSYGVAVFGRPADVVNGWQRQVARQIDEVSYQLQTNGYGETHEPRVGRLPLAQTAEFQIRLYRGLTYSIVGVCDEDCTELHLSLLDESGAELDSDIISENYPVLAVRPAHTGRYRVTVTMAACSAEPCYYGVGVYGVEPASTLFQPSANSLQPAANECRAPLGFTAGQPDGPRSVTGPLLHLRCWLRAHSSWLAAGSLPAAG